MGRGRSTESKWLTKEHRCNATGILSVAGRIDSLLAGPLLCPRQSLRLLGFATLHFPVYQSSATKPLLR
jgi:hypothetical protein